MKCANGGASNEAKKKNVDRSHTYVSSDDNGMFQWGHLRGLDISTDYMRRGKSLFGFPVIKGSFE